MLVTKTIKKLQVLDKYGSEPFEFFVAEKLTNFRDREKERILLQIY